MTTDKHIDAPAHTPGRLHIRVRDRLSGEQNAMSKSDLIDVTVQLHHETDRAVLVSDDGDRDKAVWLPLSQCEIEKRKGGIVIATMPEWLALEKGLI